MGSEQTPRLDDSGGEVPGLDRDDLEDDPIAQFQAWFERAGEVNPMPEAMTLATVGNRGRPDARMVLLKGAGRDGFRFFTHYRGTKAEQIAQNPAAALVFHWPELHRQVRIRGRIEKLGADESDDYFASRDRVSQIGAWASPQSQVLKGGRAELEQYTTKAEEGFITEPEIPRPDHWGGYLVKPEEIEFWQGRPGRLHDRFIYRLKRRRWRIERLAP